MSSGGSSDNLDLGAFNDPMLGADPGTPGAIDPNTFDFGTTDFSDWFKSGSGNILSRFLSGTSTSSDKGLATLGFGLASLAAALRNTPPEVKIPKYQVAPVYNRALTAPMLPPQPPNRQSESGQNIYNPMVGLPLFFNPNPFQFNPTEAAKRYGPTPEEIAQGYQGYVSGLERLYNTLGTQPEITMETKKQSARIVTGKQIGRAHV